MLIVPFQLLELLGIAVPRGALLFISYIDVLLQRIYNMQQLLTYLRTKIKTWRDRRFLKKHGCDNWYQYNRQYDPDINWRATRIKDFYQGYPYVYCFENHKHEVYYWDLGIDGACIVGNWCDENCKDKHRMDFHRAMNAPGTAWEWHINELGGGDYIFAAFKDPEDFFMFSLKWA
jgi:hypothetical protein